MGNKRGWKPYKKLKDRLTEMEEEYKVKFEEDLTRADSVFLIKYFENLVRCGALTDHYRVVMIRKEMMRRMEVL